MDGEERKQPIHNDERKQAPRRLPHPLLEEVHSDFAMAMTLQEQQRAFIALTSLESESESESDEEGSNSDANDYEFFETHDFEAELDFLQEGEEEDSYSDEDEEMEMEEDDIDPDQLTYEELIALGEFIGQEHKGLPINEIPALLHPCKYQPLETKTSIHLCVICQIEYQGGESVVALPCHHPYHSQCITQWLQVNKICPICSVEVSSVPAPR
ncbi:hypothetical protein Tsubulata_039096 [Turnera subulata]|uniref:RING-type domain-containing protein n=1 Tax=Turnera subulata TaxID=218843 RepID=A0A9Q0GIU6_9ROSI|nr:hypothetical protein Tsubulata_039096 [Turnera subulata]